MKPIALGAVLAAVAAAGLGAFFYWTMAAEHAYDATDLLRIREAGKVLSFEVIDSSDSTLWRITSAGGAEGRRIDYGVVPQAFQQEVPAGSMGPRTFVVGEALKSKTVTETHILVHEGRATGAGAMSWGLSTFTPRSFGPVQR